MTLKIIPPNKPSEHLPASSWEKNSVKKFPPKKVPQIPWNSPQRIPHNSLRTIPPIWQLSTRAQGLLVVNRMQVTEQTNHRVLKYRVGQKNGPFLKVYDSCI